jgi:hypothetical protein
LHTRARFAFTDHASRACSDHSNAAQFCGTEDTDAECALGETHDAVASISGAASEHSCALGGCRRPQDAVVELALAADTDTRERGTRDADRIVGRSGHTDVFNAPARDAGARVTETQNTGP